ncbi:MAG TPA: tripartite tricarboxylate transporter substrate-binding protein [Candidatus Hydrogenedentes bacterium]|nr:tripartite tricarboxylate transporter substrate-binding protein [Candidatus Hydrogenedentota bacterium]
MKNTGHIIAALVLAVITGCARTAQYPNQPLVLICPWSAGGGTDRVARQVAAQLETGLGVPVNVVNATGGGGVTGHTRGALARPNGYTFTLVTAELNMLHWRGLTNISCRDYAPLMLINRDDAALFVRKDAPWNSLQALETAVRDAPETLKASGTAYGGIWHVALAGWLTTIGLSPGAVTWISINGSAPSLQELMAGGIDAVCCSLPEAQALLDAGEVRCLGLMSDQRLPAFPGVPTFPEMGVNWTMGTWRGLALPRGVPEARRETLLAAIRAVVESDEYHQFMRQAGFNPAALGPEPFTEFLAQNDAQMGAILSSEAFKGVESPPVGPMAFPWLAGVLLLANFLALALTGKFRRPPGQEPFTKTGAARIVLVVAAVLTYILLAERLGFVLAMALVVFVLLWRFRMRWPLAALVSALVVLAVYQIFAGYLGVPLPRGFWGG